MDKSQQATQKEILSGDATPAYNRANDVRRDDDNLKELSIGLKDLDYAIKYYFDNVIQPSFDEFGSRRPVPVIYGSTERWKNIDYDGYFRDREGKILVPLIAYKRTGVTKNRALGSKVDANHPQVYYSQQIKYNQQNRYDQFSKLTNLTPAKSYVNTVMADYVDLTYDVIVWTDYIEQMNEIVEAILYSEGSFWGEKDRFKFRAKIDAFTNTTDALIDQERVVRTNFTITLFGYIVPDVTAKHLSEKLSNKTNSPQQVVVTTSVQAISQPGLSAFRVGTDVALFRTQLQPPTAGMYDLGVMVNNTTVPLSTIKNVSQLNDGTVSVEFNIEELGYTLSPNDNIQITQNFAS